MSLYTFDAKSLTTAADLARQPTLNAGQVVRTLALFAVFAIAVALVVHIGAA